MDWVFSQYLKSLYSADRCSVLNRDRKIKVCPLKWLRNDLDFFLSIVQKETETGVLKICLNHLFKRVKVSSCAHKSNACSCYSNISHFSDLGTAPWQNHKKNFQLYAITCQSLLKDITSNTASKKFYIQVISLCGRRGGGEFVCSLSKKHFLSNSSRQAVVHLPRHFLYWVLVPGAYSGNFVLVCSGTSGGHLVVFLLRSVLVISQVQMADFYQEAIPYTVFYGLWVLCHQLLFSLKTWLIRIFKGTSLFTMLLLLTFYLTRYRLQTARCEVWVCQKVHCWPQQTTLPRFYHAVLSPSGISLCCL